MREYIKHITQSICADFEQVYEFASNPANLPRWAGGLSSAVTKEGDDWVSDSPMGKVKVRFAPKNSFGVLDHDVTLPNGVTVHNPLRVMKAPNGSEIVFTLFRQDGMTDEEFNRDAAMVTQDLENLRRLLETPSK